MNPQWQRWFMDFQRIFGDPFSALSESLVVATGSDGVIESLTGLALLIAGAANQIMVTDDGDGSVTLSIPSSAVITFANTGLRLLDTGGDHYITIQLGSDVSANRTLAITTGDANRTIILSGNPTLADWFDQAVKVASSPTHVGLTLSGLSASLLTYTTAAKALASLAKQAAIADASTSHSITDPADAPATADVLRDDLVANAIPDIEVALDALGAKINTILVALETAMVLET